MNILQLIRNKYYEYFIENWISKQSDSFCEDINWQPVAIAMSLEES